MDDKYPSVSEGELSVLKALWLMGPTKVAQVRSALQVEGVNWAYNTVQTVLNRLEAKGYVSSKKKGRALVYAPEVDQTHFLGAQLDDLAERVCAGSKTPMMLALFKGKTFDKKDIKTFRDLLDDLEREGGDPA